MGNPRLYDYCRIGTKKVIEDFTGELLQHLRLLSSSIETIDNPVELRSHLELFKALRHTVGNSALLLSGGASLGFHHVGVIKALHEAKLLPRIITGSSSGAIVAAIACTRIDEEFEATLRWENINITLLEPTMSESFLTDAWIKLRRIFTTGAVIDIGVLRQAMRDNVGDMTFLEAYRRTQRVLNITVSTATTYEMPRLLNYITAPDVLIWSAAVASCAFPGFFHSVHLLAKDAKGNIVPWNVTEDRWIDGSVENDLPMRRLSELFNVNFFIVSQVNFHISPFLVPTVDRSPPGLIRKVVGKLAYVAYSELVFRLQQVRQLGIFPRLCHFALSILCQKYCGDVTIVPKIPLSESLMMFSDLRGKNLDMICRRGEQATWPRNDCFLHFRRTLNYSQSLPSGTCFGRNIMCYSRVHA